MTRTLLAGGRIIDPASGTSRRGGRDEFADLLIDGGRIAAIGPADSLGPADETLDCRGRLVVPGLIDLHVHLREPPAPAAPTMPAAPAARRVSRTAAPTKGTPSAEAPAETIASGAAAAAAGGFTTVCAMPNTRPPIDAAEAVAYYLARARETGLARVLVVGCQTAGRAGRRPADLAAMRAAGAVAFSDDGSDVADPQVFEQVLREGARLGLPLFCHCEDAGMAAGGVINDGPLATALGLPGIPPEAEEAAVRRACDGAARTGCRVHICHVSTEGAVAAIRRAKAAGAPVTAEAAPHHLVLTEEALAGRDTVFKVNPPLRSSHDACAVLGGVRDGTIDCLATDHAPHTAEAKRRPLAEAPPGMIGLESALPIYVKALVEPGLLEWAELVARLTVNPARVLGMDAGRLAVGAAADVTVIDPLVRWTIDPQAFESRGRNCPFAGREVRGRAVLTIVGGRIVYRLTL
ncbi:MAG: dihydroorotase [Planctomycetes bacterium]|nr:dihydroorotase [Planctomycetota bacterium]